MQIDVCGFNLAMAVAGSVQPELPFKHPISRHAAGQNLLGGVTPI
jgi:hypothetical protein